jgi:hypothetical protein
MAIPPAPGASAPGTTVVEVKVYGAKLDQEKINRLIRASTDGVTPPTAELTTVWNGARLRADSLNGLRTAIQDRLEPGDARCLENLRISTGDDQRGVAVDVSTQSVTVTIESTDGAWALGRGEQFRKILLHAAGSLTLRRWYAARLALVGLVVAAAMTALLALDGVVDSRLGSTLTSVSVATAAAIASFLMSRLCARRNETVLWIDGSIPRSGWNGLTVAERVATLALVVSLSALIVNIFK